jgi:purine nucleosidase/pyrimidine-specific ribonucleoside hydrolase
MPRRVIIDTDPGVDDALALILALQSPELYIDAITTVSGNVDVELATQNTLTILELFSPERRPPVARGANRPLVGVLNTAVHVHGDDGLGGVSRMLTAAGQPCYPAVGAPQLMQDAVVCILDLIRRAPGELTLVALGPLTNLALAWRRDAHAFQHLVELVIMGGAVTVPGNVTPVAEFNIHVDPEAAQIVFASGVPITLIGLDVTERVRLTGELIDLSVRPVGSPLSQFVMDCTARTIAYSSRVERPPGMAMHDPLAVGALIDPTLVHTVPLSVQVETKGELTRGMLVADRRHLRSDLVARANVRVALDVDADRFLEMFLRRLQTP